MKAAKRKPLVWVVLALGAAVVFLIYRQHNAAAVQAAPAPSSVQVVPSGDAGGGGSYGGSSQGAMDTTPQLVSTLSAEPVASGVLPADIGRNFYGPGPAVGPDGHPIGSRIVPVDVSHGFIAHPA